MKKRKLWSLRLIDRFYSFEKKHFPRFLLLKLYQYVNNCFKEEAIECYLSDLKDIGFFESFILGSDETKKLAKDSHKAISAMKKQELLEKLTGYARTHDDNRRRKEENEVMLDNIITKKRRVVETLSEKNEIIKYLGRRIVVRDETLYEFLEKLYSAFEKDLHINDNEET